MCGLSLFIQFQVEQLLSEVTSLRDQLILEVDPNATVEVPVQMLKEEVQIMKDKLKEEIQSSERLFEESENKSFLILELEVKFCLL